ncbi:hypothetical protein K2X14_11615 [Acetobacter sp. TBRC 12305]|uniref:Phage tail lysozyme domain-containing protein n=1 Tax=Acetobacter garciniae TaxID=2817435 RepID=A0A939HPG2_9PROT|nr:phage tail tip lysozyme [Acetobacter garciniae]MBO1325342.1 hypothetical protein [Acetobacter garciniae]MBX0345486.1 hypothetical protein [Acetobacter garciniae]
MATVIDALIVTLGLDPKGVQQGQKQANNAFGKVTQGAQKMGDGVSRGVDNATEAFTKLRREALAFMAVLTAGKTLKAFIADTTTSNVALGNMSRNLGVSVQSLGAWQKVAQSFGGTADDVSGSMQSLVSQFQTVEGRQNLGRVFGQMGVQLVGANGQLENMNKLIPAMARASQILGPQLFSALAGSFASQGFINMLEQGPDKLKQVHKALQQYAPNPEDVKASAQLLEDWTLLTAKSEAFGRSIMTDLSPEVHELFTMINNFVDQNRESWLAGIKTGVDNLSASLKKMDWKQVGRDISDAITWLRSLDWKRIGSDIEKIGSAVDYTANNFGGWAKIAEVFLTLWAGKTALNAIKNALALAAAFGKVGIVLAALEAYKKSGIGDRFETFVDEHIPGFGALDNFLSKAGLGRSYGQQAIASSDSDTSPEARAKAADMFKASGMDQTHAMAAMANAIRESKLDPFAKPKNGEDAYGLFQWHSDRRENYRKVYGHSMESVTDRDQAMKEQIGFLNWELNNTEKTAGNYFRNANDAKTAAAVLSMYGIRPAGQATEAWARGELADYLNTQNAPAGTIGADAAASQSSATAPQTIAQAILSAPATKQVPAQNDSLGKYMEDMQRSVDQAQASAPVNNATTNTTNNTTNITVHAPGGDPHVVRQAVKSAFNDPRVMAWQVARGLA